MASSLPFKSATHILTLCKYIQCAKFGQKRRTAGISSGMGLHSRMRCESSTGPVEKVDDRFDYGESRVYAVGLVNGLEITVVYTDENDEERRIISAWRAEPHERRSYWQNIEG